MKLISQEKKEAIVKKALNRGTVPLRDVAIQNNVSYPSITKWVRQYKNNELKTTTTVFSDTSGSKSAKLGHIIATASLDDTAIGVYCRERGLYAHQIEKWKTDFMKHDNNKDHQVLLAETKALRSEIKLLKQDIRRKDRALAETAALLILKKKADALWGDSEDV
jgi:transposase-like protein